MAHIFEQERCPWAILGDLHHFLRKKSAMTGPIPQKMRHNYLVPYVSDGYIHHSSDCKSIHISIPFIRLICFFGYFSFTLGLSQHEFSQLTSRVFRQADVGFLSISFEDFPSNLQDLLALAIFYGFPEKTLTGFLEGSSKRWFLRLYFMIWKHSCSRIIISSYV